MTSKTLNAAFTRTRTTARDFIRWAEVENGVKFSESNISHIRRGNVAISKAMTIAFKQFFKQLKND